MFNLQLHGSKLHICNSIFQQVYEYITAYLPYYVYFIQAAGFCALSAALAFAIVPETKGMSIAEITDELDCTGLPFQGWGNQVVATTYVIFDGSANSDGEPILTS